jgi:hypothetical protein
MGISDGSTVCHKNSSIVSPSLRGAIGGCPVVGNPGYSRPDRMDSLQRELARRGQGCTECEDARLLAAPKKPLQCTARGTWR